MIAVADLRAFLQGRWRVERTISDRRQGIEGRLSGLADFVPAEAGDTLVYSERGTLQFGDHEGPAEQSYTYVFGPSDGTAAVYFRDGRLFHGLDLSHGSATFIHACPPDRYEGSMSLIDHDHWRLDWTIEGPRKDLGIATLYSRTS